MQQHHHHHHIQTERKRKNPILVWRFQSRNSTQNEEDTKYSRGYCYNLIKYIVFGFNVLFWVLGCLILGVGLYIRLGGDFTKIIGENLPFMYSGANILLVVATGIMVTGFLGCCGAIRESQWMLTSFFLILFAMFLLLIGAGIWAVASKPTLESELRRFLTDSIHKYKRNGKRNDETEFLDYIQRKLKCCGLKGHEDYAISKIPATCGNNVEAVKRRGCLVALLIFGNEKLLIIAATGIGISFIMVLGMVFSLMLCCILREDKNTT